MPGDNATTAHSGQRDPREKPFFDSLNKRIQAPAIQAAKHATETIPMVLVTLADPGVLEFVSKSPVR